VLAPTTLELRATPSIRGPGELMERSSPALQQKQAERAGGPLRFIYGDDSLSDCLSDVCREARIRIDRLNIIEVFERLK